MKNLTKTQKLTISALCMALYLVVMMCTQSFAFGQYQVRIATALYGLSAIFPFLIIPFGLVNVLANTLMTAPTPRLPTVFPNCQTNIVTQLLPDIGLPCRDAMPAALLR